MPSLCHGPEKSQRGTNRILVIPEHLYGYMHGQKPTTEGIPHAVMETPLHIELSILILSVIAAERTKVLLNKMIQCPLYQNIITVTVNNNYQQPNCGNETESGLCP